MNGSHPAGFTHRSGITSIALVLASCTTAPLLATDHRTSNAPEPISIEQRQIDGARPTFLFCAGADCRVRTPKHVRAQ